MNDLVDDTTPQLGGNLDVNGYSIISAASQAGSNGADIILDPNGAGVVTFAGNSTKGSGQFKLNCENNSHAITIKGPAHSAAASYVYTYPINMGSSGQVLSTDGTSTTSWVTVLQPNVNNNIANYVDDADAASAGVVIGGIYRTGNDLKVRLA